MERMLGSLRHGSIAALAAVGLWAGSISGQTISPESGVVRAVQEEVPPGRTLSIPPDAFPPEGSKVLDTVNFEDLTLTEAMKLFSEQTGLNVITSTEAGKTKITVFLRNVTAMAALDAIVKTNNLFYRIDEQSDIIRIATADEYEKNLATFRDEQTRVFTLLYPNPVAVAQAIRHLYGERVSLNQADTDFNDLMDLTQRLSRFDLIDGRSLGLGSFQNTGQLQGFAGRNGGGANFGGGFGGGGLGMGGLGMGGLGMGGFGAMGGMGGMNGGFGNGALGRGGIGGFNNNGQQQDNSLFDLGTNIAKQYSSEDIQALEAQLRADGKLSEEMLNKLLERGRATIQISVIRRNNQIVVRTADPKTMEQLADLIRELDVPTPLVLLEVKVLRVQLGDGFNSAFDYQFGSQQNTAGEFVSPGTANNATLSPQIGGTDPRFSPTTSTWLGGSGITPGAFAFQIVDTHFRARMQLLESKDRVTALATPLILTSHNEVSRIFIGDSVPITSGFSQNIVNNTNNGVGQTIQGQANTNLADIGQSLLITPNINADRTVTLRLNVEISSLTQNGGRIPVQNVDGNVVQTTVDTVQRRNVSGSVVAQDGMAVVLGGLVEEEVQDNRDAIPVLGRIPGLGILFRRQATGRSRSELVIVIRPYVFNTPAESAATSHQLLSEFSLHPNSPDVMGTMNTYLPCEVIKADPECCERANLFRLHNVTPAVY